MMGTGTTRFHGHDIAPPVIAYPDAGVPSDLDEYMFHLNDYLLLKGVLSTEQVAEANMLIDTIPRDLPRGGWHGWVQREDHRGISYRQVFELGGVFERMIDNPRYLNYLNRFFGGHETHDQHHGPLGIDEAFSSIRGPGEAIPVHSGGHEVASRTGFRYHNGRFLCGEINILTAFTDIGPGDGATMIIPGSHKSNFIHPAFRRRDRVQEWSNDGGGSAEDVEGAVEVHMQAGDMPCHDTAWRNNPGERRIRVYRWGSA